MMTRSQMIKTLYRGGQVAILVELLTVLTIFVVLLFEPNFVYAQPLGGADLQTSYVALWDWFEANQFIYLAVTGLLVIAPTIAMGIIAWTWYHYFEWEGMRLMNGFAITFAIVGITLMIITLAFMTIGLSLAVSEVDKGTLAQDDIFVPFLLTMALQQMAIAVLYGIYPMWLSVASLGQRLLPLWFVAITVAIGAFNDMVLLLGGDYLWLADASGIFMVLLPFLIGAVMLLKAQRLATESYIEAHGSPPPHPTAWWDGWVTTPTHVTHTTPSNHDPTIQTSLAERGHHE